MIKTLKICNKERKFKTERKKRSNNLFNSKFYIETFKAPGPRNTCSSSERSLLSIGTSVLSKSIH